MRDRITSFKENLSQIAHDVQDVAEELEIYGSLPPGYDAAMSHRQNFEQLAESNSFPQTSSSNGTSSNSPDVSNLLVNSSRTANSRHSNCESEIMQLRREVSREHQALSSIKHKIQGAQVSNKSSPKGIQLLKQDEDSISTERDQNIYKDLRGLEIEFIQTDMKRRDLEESDQSIEMLKHLVSTLEKETADLKAEKGMHGVALQQREQLKVEEFSEYHLDASYMRTQELLKLEKDLKDAWHERDKAQHELSRLKRHLLDKELEDSEKMDEDSRLIEELRKNCESQKAHILHLENALKHVKSSHQEATKCNTAELQKAYDMIDDLKNQLASCTHMLDLKNQELLNLETALGQCYTETDAQEHLRRDLVAAREECARVSKALKDADEKLEVTKHEKEEQLAKYAMAEKLLLENKQKVQELGEDNLKLRRALELSMIRLNRMSVDSDYYVDRRIVIKLLVTYFQRNHSKEVLDLMVRMLGFSEEDKQRIGFAQQMAGKDVVRGMLGFPGRLVGGLLKGGSSLDALASMPSESQSFADLWVDFLLNKTEERKEANNETSMASNSVAAGKMFVLEQQPRNVSYGRDWSSYQKLATTSGLSAPLDVDFSSVHASTNVQTSKPPSSKNVFTI